MDTITPIDVVAAKGGVGCTSVAAAIAWRLEASVDPHDHEAFGDVWGERSLHDGQPALVRDLGVVKTLPDEGHDLVVVLDCSYPAVRATARLVGWDAACRFVAFTRPGDCLTKADVADTLGCPFDGDGGRHAQSQRSIEFVESSRQIARSIDAGLYLVRHVSDIAPILKTADDLACEQRQR